MRRTKDLCGRAFLTLDQHPDEEGGLGFSGNAALGGANISPTSLMIFTFLSQQVKKTRQEEAVTQVFLLTSGL